MQIRSSLPVLTALLLLSATPAAFGQPNETVITREIQGLRAVPDAQRPAATTRIAEEIRTLPAGQMKLKLADTLMHLATEGDPGKETLQAVVDTLAQSIKETPPAAAKDGRPAMPYMDLARLARYEGISSGLNDPNLEKADQILAANDAEVEKADFTLKDLSGKKWTLSALRGKIVLVNFWATWCPPCRKEMPDLDAIYTHFESQGLVVLSISDEEGFKVASYLRTTKYSPPVLIDSGDKVEKAFHIEGIPKTFVFDREGKLAAQSIDMRTQHQFLMMLAKAGLHP